MNKTNTSKKFKLLTLGADGKVVDTREVDLNLTRKGQPVRIKADKGVRYQLIDTDKPNDGAPDEVMTRRDGKNLQIALDDGSKADVVIEGYYEEMPQADGSLVGRAEDGSRYSYIPEDPQDAGFISDLADQGEWVHTALGSEQISGAGAAVGVLAFNPLLAAAGAGAAAAAGGGGGGGGGNGAATNGSLSEVAVSDDVGTVTGNIANNSTTDDTRPTMSGKAGSDVAKVNIYDNGNLIATVDVVDGAWSYTPSADLANGTTHSWSAKAVDAAGNVSQTASAATAFTIDTTAPGKKEDGSTDPAGLLSDVVVSDDVGTVKGTIANNSTTDDTRPTMSGTAGTDVAKVNIYDNGNLIATVDVVNGAWSYTPSADLANGTKHSWSAKAVDAAGNVSQTASAATAFTIDTTAPGKKEDGSDGDKAAPVLTIAEATDGVNAAEAADGVQTEVSLPTGTVAGDKITLTVKDPSGDVRTVDYTVTADDVTAGKANVTIPTSAISEDGAYEVSAVVTDKAGNSSAASELSNFTLDKTTPGKKEDGSDGDKAAPVLTIAEATDGVNAAEAADGVQTEVSLPTGTVAGDKITLTVKDPSGDVRTVDYTVTADDVTAGKANVTIPTSAISEDGAYEVSAVVTDKAGNSSAASELSNFTLDKTTPGKKEDGSNGDKAAPVLTIAEATDGVNAAEAADGVQTEVSLPTGTVAGDKITLTVKDPSGDVRTVDYTVTADDVTAGKANVTIPTSAISEDGAYEVSAVVTDKAGNSSAASELSNFTLDKTTPGKKEDGSDGDKAAPVLTIAEATDGVNAAEAADGVQTEVSLPTGTVAGDKITLTVKDPSGDVRTVDYTVTADDVTAGKANVTIPTSAISEDGAYEVSAVVTDKAGNSSAASELSNFTLDKTTPGKKEDGSDGDKAAPVLTIAEATDGVNAAEAADGVQTEVSLPTGTVAGDKITLTVKDPSGDVRTVDYTVTADDVTAGKANVTIPTSAISEDGAYQASAVVTDKAGNSSAASELSNFTLDKTTPGKKEDGSDGDKAAPVLTIAEATDGVNAAEAADGVQTEVSLPTGTVAGDKITLTVKDPSGDVRTVDYTVTADDVTAGKANVTIPTSAISEDGAYQASAVVTDKAGNSSAASELSNFTLDKTTPGKKEDGSDGDKAAPVLTIAEATDGVNATEAADGVQTEVSLPTGTVAGDKITLTVKDPSGDVRTVDYTVTADDVTAGKANVTIPTSAISEDGAYQASAVVTDKAGNSSAASAENNFTLDTTKPGQQQNSDGTYTDGSIAAPVLTIAEAVDGVNATEAADGVQTEVTLPTGTVAGDTITLTVEDPSGDVRTVDYTVTADDVTAGKANVTIPTSAISEDGAYQASAVVTDKAGNSSAASAENNFTLDTTKPGQQQNSDGTYTDGAITAPVLSIAEAANGVSASEAADGIQTEVTLPTGTVAGDTITLTVKDPSGDVRTVDYTVTADDVTAGKANVTIPTSAISEDGAYQASAVVTDKAGNSSAASELSNFTLDTTAPGKKEDGTDDPAGVLSDVVVSDDVGTVKGTIANYSSTDDTRPTMSGKAGTDVAKVNIYEGEDLIATVDVVNGAWSYTPSADLANGTTHSWSAKAVDAAGNEAAEAVGSTTFTIDTVGPLANDLFNIDLIDDVDPQTGSVSNTYATNDRRPELKGDATSDVKFVNIYDGTTGTNVLVTTVAVINGHWTYTPTADLTEDKTYVWRVRPVDAAGNEGEWSARQFILDTKAPTGLQDFVNYVDDVGPVFNTTSAAKVTNDAKPALLIPNWKNMGIDQASLYVDGTKVEATYSSVDGSLTPVNALSEGEHTFTYTLTDLAGNESQQAAHALTIDIDTVSPDINSASTANVDENTAANSVVYQAASSDAHQVTYSLGAADLSLFSIDATTGAVTLKASPDFETRSSYSFTVLATDEAGNVSQKVVTLNVNDLTESLGMQLATDSGRDATDRITNVGTVNVVGLLAGATWKYQVDGVGAWIDGVGSSFVAQPGQHTYTLHQFVNGAQSVDAPTLVVNYDTVAPGYVAGGGFGAVPLPNVHGMPLGYYAKTTLSYASTGVPLWMDVPSGSVAGDTVSVEVRLAGDLLETITRALTLEEVNDHRWNFSLNQSYFDNVETDAPVLRATVTDAAGNVSEVGVDLPAAATMRDARYTHEDDPAVLSDPEGTMDLVNDRVRTSDLEPESYTVEGATLVFSGTAQPNSTVKIYDNFYDYDSHEWTRTKLDSLQLGPGDSNGTATWKYTTLNNMAVGLHKITVVSEITNSLGQVVYGDESDSLSFTLQDVLTLDLSAEITEPGQLVTKNYDNTTPERLVIRLDELLSGATGEVKIEVDIHDTVELRGAFDRNIWEHPSAPDAEGYRHYQTDYGVDLLIDDRVHAVYLTSLSA